MASVPEEATIQAARCLHCDCRGLHACKLRKYADLYGADPKRYKENKEKKADRREFEQDASHADAIFEPGKCIDCGLCIQIAAAAGESPGLTFIGRGFNVRVAVPLSGISTRPSAASPPNAWPPALPPPWHLRIISRNSCNVAGILRVPCNCIWPPVNTAGTVHDQLASNKGNAMSRTGWKQLLAGAPWVHGPGKFPITAYSEFMPPPRLGRKPYGAIDPGLFSSDDPLGWRVTEYEEEYELRPGLLHLGGELVTVMEHLGNGRPAHGISNAKLEGNPFWPPDLAWQAGRLPHERYVIIAPLALSRTQDDKGRVRWTLFGGSEQGPERAFWQGFFTGPGREISPHEGRCSSSDC